MAVDKLVDSTQLDADLTSVANAIRTKGGTSGQLTFPSGFVQAIGDIPGGTDFTGEWQRPSDWPALPNDIGTYSGQYFLYKIETGKTAYKMLLGNNRTADIGVTDAVGNFTSLLTITNTTGKYGAYEFDISNLQLDSYFWARGELMGLSINTWVDVVFEPVVESIVSNCSTAFYEPTSGTVINAKTVHFLANKWYSDYVYNFDTGQNTRCVLQCVEFYGGSWYNDIVFPINCNKIVIDGVAVSVRGGKIFGNNGRGNSQYGYAQYASVSIGTNTALRINFCGGSTAEAQSILNKLGDLSGVTNFEAFWHDGLNITSLDFTGNKITAASKVDSAFSNCFSLRSITWGETDLSGITSMNAMFDGCRSIESIAIPGTDIHIGSGNAMYLAFRNCSSVKTIDLSNVDFSSATTFGSMVDGCVALENLTFKQNAGIANNIGVSGCSLLTVNSLLSLFNALATVTAARTCTIGATNLAKLTAEQKAIATDKGWTLA